MLNMPKEHLQRKLCMCSFRVINDLKSLGSWHIKRIESTLGKDLCTSLMQNESVLSLITDRDPQVCILY